MDSKSSLVNPQGSQRSSVVSNVSEAYTNREISGSSSRSTNPQSSDMTSTLGIFRGIYVVCLCSTGSFLFAYDTGIVGGVLNLSSFQRDFRYSKAQKTQVNSNCVSIFQGGKWGIVISLIVLCVGAILQVVNVHSIGLFYAGRVISGLGTGGATVMVPLMAAEFSEKKMRGRLRAMFQLLFATGVCISCWVTYAASVGIDASSSVQWQVPVGLQLVPGGLLGLGILLIHESPRWLTIKGRSGAAYESLRWIRGGVDTPDIEAEFQEILAGVQLEIQASEGFRLKELLLPSNRYRMFVAVAIQLAAQLTGNTSLAYYAPQFFVLLGPGDKSVLITGFFGLVKIAGVVLFIAFLVDALGRRKPLMGGALAMGILMLIVAIIIVKDPPNPANGISSAGAAGIAMIYLEAFASNFSWGPGAGSQWLFNFVMSQVTSHAVANIGWRTFLMSAIFNFANIAYVWFFIKETNGKSLEQMEVVFSNVHHVMVKDPESQGHQTTTTIKDDNEPRNELV